MHLLQANVSAFIIDE